MTLKNNVKKEGYRQEGRLRSIANLSPEILKEQCGKNYEKVLFLLLQTVM
jgi:hypothetical protein